MRPRLTVVGGGWAGCSAALEAGRRGSGVLLLEAASALGGRGGSFRDPLSGEELDRGQHLFLGAYGAALGLLEELGSAGGVELQPRLELPYLAADGRLESLRAAALPGPLGLAGGLRGFAPLKASAPALARLGLFGGGSLALAAAGLEAPSASRLSVDAWLRACGQGPRERDWLWDPLALAALNARPEEARLREFLAALAQGFLRGGRRSALGRPRLPLARLLEPLGAWLERRGGALRLGCPLRSAAPLPRGGWSLELASGERLESDHLLLALPAAQAARLLGPQLAARLGLEAEASRPRSPIVSAWLWSEEPLLPAPLLAFGPQAPGLQARFHWGFAEPAAGGWRSCLVASAARELAGLGQAALLAELSAFLAARGRPFRFRRARVVCERAATAVFAPGSPPRLPQATGLPGLALAGDWTETGLPCTLESAARSGVLAARALS